MAVAGAVGNVGVAVHHRAQGRGKRDDGRLVHGDLDPLALAGALALHERAQDAGAEMDAGQEVADRGAGLGRRPVGHGRWRSMMPLMAWMVTSMAARSR